MTIGSKVTNFFRQPHFPVFLLSLIRKIAPPLARLLTYGHLNPNTKEYWDQRYSTGEYQQGEDERYAELRRQVISLVPAGSRVLDVGCGTGRFMQLLREQRDCSCTGIDISAVSVELANQKGFDAFQSKLPILPSQLPTNSFDVCTVIETLEHITSTDKTLQQLSGTLRESGHIIIAVPDNCMTPKEFDEHVAYYTKESLGQLVARYFQVEESLSVESLGLRYLVIRARKVSLAMRHFA